MTRYFVILISILILISLQSVQAMPALDGGSEPDYAEGVNMPEIRELGRDDSDLEGEWNCLILMVDFDDYTWDNQDDTLFNNEDLLFDIEHFEAMLFSEEEFAHPGSESEFTGSMRDYYSEISRDMFTVTGIVTEWYRAPEDYSYYTDDNYGTGGYPNNSQGLLEDILEIADNDIDFAEFDNDEDGRVDAIFLVHAGPGAEEFGRNDNGRKYIWSHKWNIARQERDGVSISGYTVEPQTGAIGVFCHEFGHALSLPDLYDTDYSSEGIGEWGLMGAAGWTHRAGDPWGTSPGHMCAWSKDRLGWIEIINVEETLEEETITPIAEDGIAYRLWRNGDINSQEYFLVENRRRIGFDAGLTRRQVINDLPAPEGLLITHIDDRLNRNSDENHRLVDVEEASVIWVDGEPVEHLDLAQGGSALNLNNRNRGDNGDLWPGFSETNEDSTDWDGERDRTRFGIFTTPSSVGYDGMPSMAQIYDIEMDGENVIATLTVDPPDGPVIYIVNWTYSDENDGNGNGFIEPGEVVELTVEIGNLGGVEADPISAILSGDAEWLEIIENETGFSELRAGDTEVQETPFILSIDIDAPGHASINLVLQVTVDLDYEFEFKIPLEIKPPRDWYKYPENPVLDGGDDDWDAEIINPSVIVDGDTIHCWYIGNSGQEDPGAIGYAWSIDGGITWERADDPLIEPETAEWFEGGFWGIDVIDFGEDGYVMVLSGVDQESGNVVTGFATSANGLAWEVAEEPALGVDDDLEGLLTQGPLSLYDVGDGWTGLALPILSGGGSPTIGLGFTDDFVEWSFRDEPVIEGSGNFDDFDGFAALAPDVYKNDDNYLLHYSGFGFDFTGRIGVAVSDDGASFEKRPGIERGGSVLAPGGIGSWDREEWLFGSSVYEWDGELHMLYSGVTSDQSESAVGLALSFPFDDRSALDITDSRPDIPGTIILDPAYPNPFNSKAVIPYRLKTPGAVKLSIIDIAGRIVISYNQQHATAGSYYYVWNGRGYDGISPASGMYIVRLEAGGSEISGSLMLLK